MMIKKSIYKKAANESSRSKTMAKLASRSGDVSKYGTALVKFWSGKYKYSRSFSKT